MDYLHAKRIVHFDLKAANMLIGWKEGSPSAKVCEYAAGKACATLEAPPGGAKAFDLRKHCRALLHAALADAVALPSIWGRRILMCGSAQCMQQAGACGWLRPIHAARQVQMGGSAQYTRQAGANGWLCPVLAAGMLGPGPP